MSIGVSVPKEQEELRWGRALNYIRYYIIKEYEGKKLEEIEDETDREIVKIIRQLNKKYEKVLNDEENIVQIEKKEDKLESGKKNVRFVKKLGNEKLNKTKVFPRRTKKHQIKP